MPEEREHKHGIKVPTQETDVTKAMLGAKGRMDTHVQTVTNQAKRAALAQQLHLVDAQLSRAHTEVARRRGRHRKHADHHLEEEPVGPTPSARAHPGTWEARRARDLSLRKRRPVVPKPVKRKVKPSCKRTEAEAESRLRTLMAEVDTNLYQLTLPEQVRDAEGWFLKKRSNNALKSKSIANPLVASQRWGPTIAEHKA